ncbi:hypothetical protein HanPI659440_Chr17g0665901 [Helianthus annuus]|nr:hypothetical protein HanPI659440_Chr17g0665901 [Helianthus annuus]
MRGVIRGVSIMYLIVKVHTRVGVNVYMRMLVCMYNRMLEGKYVCSYDFNMIVY